MHCLLVGYFFWKKSKYGTCEQIFILFALFQHTAPQHRQYLSYEGFGAGTPSEREKQYQKFKASTAIQNVYEHRINKLNAKDVQTLLVKDKQRAKDIKTRFVLIQ